MRPQYNRPLLRTTAEEDHIGHSFELMKDPYCSLFRILAFNSNQRATSSQAQSQANKEVPNWDHAAKLRIEGTHSSSKLSNRLSASFFPYYSFIRRILPVSLYYWFILSQFTFSKWHERHRFITLTINLISKNNRTKLLFHES